MTIIHVAGVPTNDGTQRCIRCSEPLSTCRRWTPGAYVRQGDDNLFGMVSSEARPGLGEYPCRRPWKRIARGPLVSETPHEMLPPTFVVADAEPRAPYIEEPSPCERTSRFGRIVAATIFLAALAGVLVGMVR